MADRDSDEEDDSEEERHRLVNEIGWQGQQDDHGDEHEHEHDVEHGEIYPAEVGVDIADGAGVGVSPSGDWQEGGDGEQVPPGSR